MVAFRFLRCTPSHGALLSHWVKLLATSSCKTLLLNSDSDTLSSLTENPNKDHSAMRSASLMVTSGVKSCIVFAAHMRPVILPIRSSNIQTLPYTPTNIFFAFSKTPNRPLGNLLGQCEVITKLGTAKVLKIRESCARQAN